MQSTDENEWDCLRGGVLCSLRATAFKACLTKKEADDESTKSRILYPYEIADTLEGIVQPTVWWEVNSGNASRRV